MKRLPEITLNFGTRDADTMIGTDDNDMLFGLRGRDVLIGGRGDDVLVGGRGADYLSGNQGQDVLLGGGGADVFVFDGDFDQDLVLDFRSRKGDTLEFVLYEEERLDWTSETLLGMCSQQGRDLLIALPDSDETVTLRDLKLARLDASMIEVTHYAEPDLLV